MNYNCIALISLHSHSLKQSAGCTEGLDMLSSLTSHDFLTHPFSDLSMN